MASCQRITILEEMETLLSDTLSLHAHAALDVLLTDSYLTLHQHLREGRLNPRTFQRVDRSSTPDTIAIASLRRAVPGSVSAELLSAEPKSGQYLETSAATNPLFHRRRLR
jgi:hypothetical protein